MPSKAFKDWVSAGKKALDEMEAAHRAIGGKGRGRRWATLQVNHAYAVILSSQFQGFCRALHSEAVDYFAMNTKPHDAAFVLRMLMTDGRKLDHGNPNPGNIASDFRDLGMLKFWDQVEAVSATTPDRRRLLEELNKWRNAIAHQDWTAVGNPKLTLATVRAWRSACDALARSFDKAVRGHLAKVVGAAPW